MTDADESQVDRKTRLDAALAEYLRRVDLQGTVDRNRFVEEFPDLAEELSKLLHTVECGEHVDDPRCTVEYQEHSEIDTTGAEPAGQTATYHPDQPPAAPDRGVAESQDGFLGRRFGDYEILRELGHGGMGVVYLARQIGLDRPVALKMIRSGVLASKKDVRRFQIEARAAGKLAHPNIVQVHQVGELDGQHFYAMEYVEGSDLADLTRSGPLSVEQAAVYVRDIANGVHHAHLHGIIHRDLKPANVVIGPNGRPRITDFGLAKDVGREKGLTDSGTSLGTPSYMSPEQAAARLEEVAPASDIYSLGAILYELLTGRPPFKADSPLDTLLDVIHNEPTAPRSLRPSLDPQIEAICLKCLSKDPSRRYATAKGLAEDLDRYLDDEPVRARPVGRMMKAWYWLRDVPVIAAVAGRRVTSPTRAHQFTQWATLGLLIVLLAWAAIGILSYGGEKSFPSRVRIASGSLQGEYHAFAQALGERLKGNVSVPIEVLVTDGAVDNRKRLVNEDAELALLQASAVSSNDLLVVAPLYPEAVYFVVRTESDLDQLGHLAGKKIAIGAAESGMQLSARRVFDRLSINAELVDGEFSEFAEHPQWDAAVVTSGPHNEKLRSLLRDKRFRLLSLTDDEIDELVDPVFRPTTIHAGDLTAGSPDTSEVPAKDVRTVATTTFLVVGDNASSEFVRTVLETLYSDGELEAQFGLVSRKRAAQWPALPLHPAAHEFFQNTGGTE